MNMKKDITPENIRHSTLTHLRTLKTLGVEHVMLPSRAGQTASALTTQKRKAQTRTVASEKNAVKKRHQPSAGVKRLPAEEKASSEKQEAERISTYRNPEFVPRTGEKLDHIRSLTALQEFIGPCPRCKLCKGRKNVVFGTGNPKAELMFVGEGPGADEDEQGVPFVGRAGKLLNKMIEAMGLKREDVYIANVVKCRPPNNRAPEPDEVETCIPFLMKQVELIEPKHIVCLGKSAAQAVLNTQIAITKMRGRFQELNGVAVMPTYHPAFLLRNPAMKKFVWEDLQQVMKKMGLKSRSALE